MTKDQKIKRSTSKYAFPFLKPVMALLFFLTLFLGCSGIEITEKNGTTHHVIIGFGVVTVNDPDDKAAVVSNTQALGVSISDRPGLKLGVGYSSSMVTTVKNGAEDVRMEISQTPGGPILINSQKAKIINPISGKEEKDE